MFSKASVGSIRVMTTEGGLDGPNRRTRSTSSVTSTSTTRNRLERQAAACSFLVPVAFWPHSRVRCLRGCSLVPAKARSGHTQWNRLPPLGQDFQPVNVIASRSAASRLVSGGNPAYPLGATPKRSLSVSFPLLKSTDKQVCPCHPNAQFLRRSVASLPLRRQGKQSQSCGCEIASLRSQ